MKLYDAGPSLNCRRVRVLARELGFSLELLSVRPGSTDADYRAQNPTGKVPTFVDDDGFVLWESGAILVHLAEKKPEAGLWPAAPHTRADILRWMFFAATHLQPWISVLGQERLVKLRLGGQPDGHAIALAERELARFLPILEQALTNGAYLAGDYSLADIFVGSSLEQNEPRGISLTPYPSIVAWRERLRARPAWAE